MDQKALGVICIFYFIKTVQKNKFELRNISFLSPTLHACFYGFFCFFLHILLVTLCIMVNETKNSKHLRFSSISLWYYETIFSKNSAKSDYSKKGFSLFLSAYLLVRMCLLGKICIFYLI